MPNETINSFKRDGVTYYQLFIKCPICNERGVNVSPSYWTHATDDGDIYLGENAYYLCEKCGCTEHVLKWRYRCSVHSTSDDDYVALEDKASFADVVSAAGMLVKKAGIPWFQELLKNL